MYRFTIRVKLNNGTFQDLQFQAESYGRAQQQVESIYGAGSALGCINEERI
jgi:hypothetical protein